MRGVPPTAWFPCFTTQILVFHPPNCMTATHCAVGNYTRLCVDVQERFIAILVSQDAHAGYSLPRWPTAIRLWFVLEYQYGIDMSGIVCVCRSSHFVFKRFTMRFWFWYTPSSLYRSWSLSGNHTAMGRVSNALVRQDGWEWRRRHTFDIIFWGTNMLISS